MAFLIETLVPRGGRTRHGNISGSARFRCRIVPHRIRSSMELTNACEIQKTADGGRRRARGEAGPEIEIQPERRLAADGRVDERNRAAKNGADEAKTSAQTCVQKIRGNTAVQPG